MSDGAMFTASIGPSGDADATAEEATSGMADISLDAGEGGAAGAGTGDAEAGAGAGSGAGSAAAGAGADVGPTPEESAAFWALEYEWHDSCAREPLLVMINSPKTTSSGFKSFTTYLVSCALAPKGVRRRYSDFEWLRSLLARRFDGVLVPMMPEKRVMNQGKEFIQGRMTDLTEFANEVARNPYLRHDASFVAFLTTADQSAWDTYKKTTLPETRPGAAAPENQGLARWQAVLTNFVLPEDADACITQLSELVVETEVSVDAVLHAARKFMERSAAYAAALQDLKDSLTGWRDRVLPIATAGSDSLAAAKHNTEEVCESLSRAGSAMAQWHDLACFQPNEVRLFLVSGMEVELQKLRAMKSLLAERRNAVAEYSKAWHDQDKAQFNLKKLKDAKKPQADRIAKAEAAVKEAEVTVAMSEKRRDDIAKGICGAESSRRTLDGASRFAKVMGQLASLNIASGLRSQQLWSEFLTAMSLDTQQMVELAQQTLSGERKNIVEDATYKDALTGFGVPDMPGDGRSGSVSASYDEFVHVGSGAADAGAAAEADVEDAGAAAAAEDEEEAPAAAESAAAPAAVAAEPPAPPAEAASAEGGGSDMDEAKSDVSI